MKFLMGALLVLLSSQVFADEAVNSSTANIAPVEQVEAPSRFHVTPTVSYTTVTLHGDSAIPWKSDSSMSLGALAELGTGMTTFQTGLIYSDYNSIASNMDIAAKAKLSYLAVPILEKLNFWHNNSNTAYFKAGLMPEILVASNVSAFGPRITGAEGIQFEKYDIPAVAGLGFTWNVSKIKAFTAEVSYLRGFTNVNKSPTDSSNIHNEGAFISAGMTVAL